MSPLSPMFPFDSKHLATGADWLCIYILVIKCLTDINKGTLRPVVSIDSHDVVLMLKFMSCPPFFYTGSFLLPLVFPFHFLNG